MAKFRKARRNVVLGEVMAQLEDLFTENIIERYFDQEYFDHEIIRDLNNYQIDNLSIKEVFKTIDEVIKIKESFWDDVYDFDWKLDLGLWIKRAIQRVMTNDQINDRNQLLQNLLIILIPNFNKKISSDDYCNLITLEELIYNELLNFINKEEIKNKISKIKLLIEKHKLIDNFKNKVLKLGFDVLEPEDKNCFWIIFGYLNPKKEIEKHKLFYCELDLFNGYSIDLKYGPNKKFGNCVRIYNELIDLKNLKINQLIPNFIDKDSIKLYNDLYEFLDNQKKFGTEYIIIKGEEK